MATTFKFGNGNWAVKEDFALAYNDENNNFKPLPFDFTRASSATRVNRQGLIETVPSGKPRIDFLDNTSGHLLLEPSRTNYITQSIDLADWASFVVSGTVTRTNNYSTSPDGLNKATRLQMSGGSSTQWTYLNVSNSATYASFYVKSTGSSSQNFRWFWNNGNNGQDFTATTEWQRFEVAVSQSSTLPMGFTTHSDLSANDILVWGVQAENGSYATSYIPTEGSSVTRSAETTTRIQPPTGVIGQSEGTLYIECKRQNGNLDFSGFGVGDGTTNNEAFIRLTTDDKIEFYVRSSNTQYVGASYTAADLNEFTKIAFTYKTNEAKMYVNGILAVNDTSVTIPTNLPYFNFQRSNNTLSFSGLIKSARVYNTALSDSDLQALTSN